MNDEFLQTVIARVHCLVAALVCSNFARFAGVKMILTACTMQNFTSFGLAESLRCSLVSF